MEHPIVGAWPKPPARPTVVTHVRSTLAVSGISALKRYDHFARYKALAEPALVDEIEGLIAGTWTPADLVLRHYEVMDRMALSDAELLVFIGGVGADLRQSVLRAVKGVVTGVGFTPWDALAVWERVWGRMFQGGGYTVRKAGPKDALVTVYCPPIARSPYFRAAFSGVNQQAMGVFARTAYTKVIRGSDSEIVMRASWV